MLKVLFALALGTAAFGDTLTFNYTGAAFDRCNGTLSGSGNCPAQAVFSTDYINARFTFSAPLAGGLSGVSEIPSVTAWTISDANRAASFSSTDANAGTELKTLLLSTSAGGAISGWNIEVSNFLGDVSGNDFFMFNPTVIGNGTGLPLADALLVNGGGNGGIGPPGPGYNLGNSVVGSWTETINGLQGGSAQSPALLVGGDPLAGVNGTIGGFGSLEYYGFFWSGGAFSATASITGITNNASLDSYLFSEGVVGSCDNQSVTLNQGDTFSGNISISNLAPGQYCIGVSANNPNDPDPNLALTFNTPVQPTPEPSSLMLLASCLVCTTWRVTKSRRKVS